MKMAQGVSQELPRSEAHVLKMISRGASMVDVLNELCSFIGEKSPGVISTVLVMDNDGTHVRLAAGPKVSKLWNAAIMNLEVCRRGSLNISAEQQGKDIPVINVGSDPSFAACRNEDFDEDVQSAWSTPILSKSGKILGILVLLCPTPHPPGERHLELMELAIHIAAIAIDFHQNEERLREFSRRLYQSQDEERRRIARELHDSTGQKLAALGMSLSIARNSTAELPPKLGEVLLECSSLTRNISDELRTLSYLLHPPLLDECGLNMAIEWYVSGINQRNALHVELELPRELCRLSEEAELAIFRIVQASLTNVHLHSKASEASVKVQETLDGVIVAVSDNGKGIPEGVLDHSSIAKSVGVGIMGMRERVEQLGGRLEIESNCTGTCVKATVPRCHFRSTRSSAAAQVAC